MLNAESQVSGLLQGYPELAKRFLQARGLADEASLRELLSPSLKNLKNPFVLDQMDLAVDRLVEAFNLRQRIAIYADFDLDGSPGLALLKEGLVGLGFETPLTFQPSRLSDGYGVHFNRLKELAEQGAQLVVTVDVGITDVEAINLAQAELGIDVIVTDHHLAKDVLPAALAIVNPNKGNCQSGLGHLCGTGVAFYLVMALKIRLTELNQFRGDFNFKSLLDLFAIATLTDMVPLRAENRSLVRHGLIQLQQTPRPALRLLLKELGLNKEALTSQDVAIRFAPKLNALSRMERGPSAFSVLSCQDEFQAERLVNETMQINMLRMELQSQATQDALIKAHAQSADLGFKWVFSEDYHKGVIGLVAVKLVEEFQMPCFVGSVKGSKIYGSSRLPDWSTSSLVQLMEGCASKLLGFGGHTHAAGFSLDLERSDEFLEAMALSVATHKPSFRLESAPLKYDVKASLSELNEEFMTLYSSFEPFGVGFPNMSVLLEDLIIVEQKVLKGLHLKFKLADSSRRRMDALWFAPPQTFVADQIGLGSQVSVVAEPQWNSFAGRRSVQLVIKDLRLKDE